MHDFSVSFAKFNTNLNLGIRQGHTSESLVTSTFLYSCYNFTQRELLCIILELFSNVPYTFQILHCKSTTSSEELHLFLKRLQTVNGDYVILDINKLSFELEVSVYLRLLE